MKTCLHFYVLHALHHIDPGLGNQFARHLDDLGFVVFAGCLNTKSPGAVSLTKECSRRLHVIEMNTTSDESIQRAVETVKKQLPKKGLWGIINNAGMNMLGDVELSPVTLYEKGFNLNMYGYIRVMKSFLPFIRQSKGRIINVSSVRGRLCEPNQSNYSTAKHAIETISDSLRLEMKKFGVKVSIIEPGNLGQATAIGASHVIERNKSELDEMWQSVREEVKEAYSWSYMEAMLSKPVGGWPPKADSSVVARAVEHALCSGLPKYRYLIQGEGSIVFFADEFVVLTLLHNIIPTWITDKYIVFWKGLKKIV
ncbi:hypothetical protein ACF0H5_003471 [Mactra antiquata]